MILRTNNLKREKVLLKFELSKKVIPNSKLVTMYTVYTKNQDLYLRRNDPGIIFVNN